MFKIPHLTAYVKPVLRKIGEKKMINLERISTKTHHPCHATLSKYPAQNVAEELKICPGYYRQIMNRNARPGADLEAKLHKLVTDILEAESKA